MRRIYRVREAKDNQISDDKTTQKMMIKAFGGSLIIETGT